MGKSRHVVKEVLGAVFIGEQCWPLPPICDREVDNDDGLLRIAVRAGGVDFRRRGFGSDVEVPRVCHHLPRDPAGRDRKRPAPVSR